MKHADNVIATIGKIRDLFSELEAAVNVITDEAKPKPLLADAKVEWMCERRDGRWVQIREIDNFSRPYHTNDGWYDINGKECDGDRKYDRDIVHTEPLAEKHSPEWAWQMWQLGNRNIRMTTNGKPNTLLGVSCDKETFVSLYAKDTTGWQLYEPEPEQPKEQKIDSGEKEYTCLICGNKMSGLDGRAEVSIKRISISNLYASTLSHYCDKCFLKLGFDETEKELRNRQQPKPESENIIHGHIPADMHLKYFHLYEFEVGDWVRTAEGDGAIIGIPLTMPDVKLTNGKIGSFHADEIFKLSPAEVVVDFGRGISGTIKRWDSTTFHIFHGNSKFSKIHIDALDTETRNLVESLLKAQGENVTQEQAGEMAKMLTEPATQYKVGDWVECVAKQGQRKLVDYLGGMGCYKTNYGEVISPCEILRKLSPSEVIVKIGCLSGTVGKAYGEERGTFILSGLSGQRNVLWLSMLDTSTREFVESLLKAQGEEK
jgi:hypothetical protein